MVVRCVARWYDRAMTPRSLLITGAASGIGRALALATAAPGRILHLCDRDAAGLEAVAADCAATGARVLPRTMDVTDAAAMAAWIGASGPLDLVVASAGVNFSSIVGRPESPAQARQVFATNLHGMLNTALPAMEVMEGQPPDARGVRGRIAVIASLAAFVSVPGAPAYCASKAAVDSWAVGNAYPARRRGIQLTSVCPGYVRTPMTAINGFRMRGLMEPDRAAAIILRAVAQGRVRIAFPWWMATCSRIGSLLPAGTAAAMLTRRSERAAREAALAGTAD